MMLPNDLRISHMIRTQNPIIASFSSNCSLAWSYRSSVGFKFSCNMSEGDDKVRTLRTNYEHLSIFETFLTGSRAMTYLLAMNFHVLRFRFHIQNVRFVCRNATHAHNIPRRTQSSIDTPIKPRILSKVGVATMFDTVPSPYAFEECLQVFWLVPRACPCRDQCDEN